MAGRASIHLWTAVLPCYYAHTVSDNTPVGKSSAFCDRIITSSISFSGYYFIYHAGIKQCRRISHIIGFSGGNVAQYAAHYFTRSCFRQPFYNLNFIRLGNRTDNFGNQVVDLLLEGFRFGHPVVTSHESADTFALHSVGISYNRCFYNLWMFVNGILDFSRTQSMTGNVEHVVHPSGDAVVSILVAAAAVP